MIPLIILVLIGVPTIRTIIRTQAAARSDALQVEVIGHQWWWEFRYPQYTMPGLGGKTDTVVTANELYLPIGKTVNFTLHSHDVIHSFWVPALAGKRDLVTNHTNYLWYTPDSVGSEAFNGACVEYCGTSHANMRFKAFTVSQADFDGWIANQKQMAVGSAPSLRRLRRKPLAVRSGSRADDGRRATHAPRTTAVESREQPGERRRAGRASAGDAGHAGRIHRVPAREAAGVHGSADADPDRPDIRRQPAREGRSGERREAGGGPGMCLACHSHSRQSVDAGQHRTEPDARRRRARRSPRASIPNDPHHLARWIKNAREMKPGVIDARRSDSASTIRSARPR